MDRKLSEGKRVLAVLMGAVQFGIVSLIVGLVIAEGPVSISAGSLFVRALPGIIVGVLIGLKFPRVALFFGMFSIGDS